MGRNRLHRTASFALGFRFVTLSGFRSQFCTMPTKISDETACKVPFAAFGTPKRGLSRAVHRRLPVRYATRAAREGLLPAEAVPKLIGFGTVSGTVIPPLLWNLGLSLYSSPIKSPSGNHQRWFRDGFRRNGAPSRPPQGEMHGQSPVNGTREAVEFDFLHPSGRISKAVTPAEFLD